MLQSCDLILYKGNGLVSKLIRLFSKSSFSHVALVLDEFHLLEIDWKYKSKIRHISYSKNNYDVYRYEGINDSQKQLILENIYSLINIKYSHWENFRSLLYIWFKIRTKDDKSKMNCLELVNDSYKKADIILSNFDTIIFEDIIKNKKLIKID